MLDPEKGLRPLLYMQVLQMCVRIPPCCRIGKTWLPCYLHASLAKLCRRTLFPNRNRGYARLLACVSLANWCRHVVFLEMGTGMPASLHAGLANLCRRTPFLPKRGGYALLFTCQSYTLVHKKKIEVCPFIHRPPPKGVNGVCDRYFLVYTF